MQQLFFALAGYMSHISAILIMSQGVGLSSEEKEALEFRTRELCDRLWNSSKRTEQDVLTERQKEEGRQIIVRVFSETK